MSYRSFRNIGRSLLAACAVSLGAASMSAQSMPSTPAPSGPNPSRWDVFLGYSYMGNHGVVKPAGVAFSSVNEGVAFSVDYWFNKYVGGEILGFGNPNGTGSGGDGFYAGYAGPVFRLPMQNYTLFAHALAGGVRGSGPNSDVPSTAEHEPWTWGSGLVAGGGMDYNIPWWNNKISLRLFEADYRYTHLDYGPGSGGVIPTGGVLGGRANLGSAELSTGLVLHFGSILPPPQLTLACSVTAPTGTIYPGDQITVSGTVGGVMPKGTVSYSWSSDAGATPGTATMVTFSAANAGTYTVKGKAVEGKGDKPYELAECSVPVTVAAFQPPTVSCSASPTSVDMGGSSTITASGMSPQNRPLTYSYSASAGSVSGNTSTATLTTAGVAGGTTISVTCNVVDDKGQTASAQTSVMINNPPPPPPPAAPTTKALCSISFDRDAKRPTRVDNEAKACLDEIALAAGRDADAKFAIVGSASSDEKMGDHKAAERAEHAKEYLVKDKGVDASRIMLYTGTAGTKSAATTEIVAGSTLDMTGLTPVDESAMMKPEPKHHHKKK